MADDLKRPGTLATAMLLALSVVAAACAKQSEVGPLHGPAEVCALNRVVDGDGVRLHCGRDRENLNIRLQCIDAPEPDQPPWGERATERLRDLVGPEVGLRSMDTDRYGRIIGRIYRNGEDVNLRLVFEGAASVYSQYCDDPVYYRAEWLARRAERGIWAEPGLHQEPWKWRRVR
jgi:endonuclease YncB( thermonuclease family)